MPEIAFVIAGVPALIVLAYFTFKRAAAGRPALTVGAQEGGAHTSAHP